MGQKVFVPITDELLYERPELITSPLRPYKVEMPCFHWMGSVVEEGDETPLEELVMAGVRPIALHGRKGIRPSVAEKRQVYSNMPMVSNG